MGAATVWSACGAQWHDDRAARLGCARGERARRHAQKRSTAGSRCCSGACVRARSDGCATAARWWRARRVRAQRRQPGSRCEVPPSRPRAVRACAVVHIVRARRARTPNRGGAMGRWQGCALVARARLARAPRCADPGPRALAWGFGDAHPLARIRRRKVQRALAGGMQGRVGSDASVLEWVWGRWEATCMSLRQVDVSDGVRRAQKLGPRGKQVANG